MQNVGNISSHLLLQVPSVNHRSEARNMSVLNPVYIIELSVASSIIEGANYKGGLKNICKGI
jgi:hypothetical protein